jgi:putative FmdB family regulatory protein
MPYYDYHCGTCGEFTLLRGIKDRDVPVECPECGVPARREVSAPNLSLMPAARRSAFTRNEKSRHEPGLATRHRCHAGCGCAGPKAPRSSAPTARFGNLGTLQTPRKRQRPWMLGH